MFSEQEVAAALAAAVDERPAIVVASAYLFGSVAEGREHRESDVDVGVLLDRPARPTAAQRFEARLRLGTRLQQRLNRPVDVVILNDAPPGLGRHVVTRGRRILVRDSDSDHAFVRDVQLRAADLDVWLRRFRHGKIEALSRP